MNEKQYINPYEVHDGSNQLAIHATHMSKATAKASIEHCIEAAWPIMAAVTALIGPLSGRLTHIVAQEVPSRELMPLEGDNIPLIQDDPDEDFKMWATAADAYYILKGEAHGRFRYQSARKMFSGYYQGGWSAIKAFEHLDSKMRQNQRPIKPRSPMNKG